MCECNWWHPVRKKDVCNIVQYLNLGGKNSDMHYLSNRIELFHFKENKIMSKVAVFHSVCMPVFSSVCTKMALIS